MEKSDARPMSARPLAINPWTFSLNGRPFFPLGGQTHNSSAYRPEDTDRAMQAVEMIGGNTLEVPVYWEQFEAAPGTFDFTLIDAHIHRARQRGLKLIILWFAAWKNGTMKYAPAWVKADRQTYRRIHGPDGAVLAGLDPTCDATLEADRRAFVALVTRIHEIDAGDRTVLAVQVENEPGIMGSDRDYSPHGERLLIEPIPHELAQMLRRSPAHPDRPPPASLDEQPTWSQAFPHSPGEAMTAWHIARFINALAEAGRRVHPELVYYTNGWLQEHSFRIPGLNYPSGGPTRNLLDVWKLATPALDLLAPDVYIREDQGFHHAASAYARPDNPLFIPESGSAEPAALHVMDAIGNLGAIGYAVFGVEDVIGQDGALRPEAAAVADSFRMVSAVLPLILKHRDSGRVHALLGRAHRYDQLIPLEGDWMACARFGGGATDYRFRNRAAPAGPGRGLLIQADQNELFLIGANLRILFKKRGSMASLFHSNSAQEEFGQRTINFVTIEEGRFDPDGHWTVTRRRNGDESDAGLWAHPEVGVVRVVLGD